MHRTTMQLQLLALVVFWLSRSKILADDERITRSKDDDFIVSKAGSACSVGAPAAEEENCVGLMQDAADNKDAFIYPTAAAPAAVVVVPRPAPATASITRKTMPFATRLEAAWTGHPMTTPQRTDAVVSVRQIDRKLTTGPPSARHPHPSSSPCAPTDTAAGDKDCAAFTASPSPPLAAATEASASGPGRDKMLTSESRRDRSRERKNSPLPLTSSPPAAKASAKTSQTIVGINQTDGLNDQTDGSKEKRPTPPHDVIDNSDDDEGVSSSSLSSSGSAIATSGVSQTTLVSVDHHLLSLSINPRTLLIVAVSGGGLAILLLLLIIAVCRCSSTGRRPKNPSTVASSKTDRGKSYPYEACNTLPPRPPPASSASPASASCQGTLSLTPDFYLVNNSRSNCPHHAHLSSAHSQRPVAMVATSGPESIDPLFFKTTAKKDVKEWYV